MIYHNNSWGGVLQYVLDDIKNEPNFDIPTIWHMGGHHLLHHRIVVWGREHAALALAPDGQLHLLVCCHCLQKKKIKNGIAENWEERRERRVWLLGWMAACMQAGLYRKLKYKRGIWIYFLASHMGKLVKHFCFFNVWGEDVRGGGPTTSTFTVGNVL